MELRIRSAAGSMIAPCRRVVSSAEGARNLHALGDRGHRKDHRGLPNRPKLGARQMIDILFRLPPGGTAEMLSAQPVAFKSSGSRQ